MAVDLGSAYRATLIDVRDLAGNPVQPTGLTFTVLPPDQSVIAPITAVLDLQPNGQVNYHADYTTTQEGLHKGTWNGTAPAISKPEWFNVVAYRALASEAEVRDALGITDLRVVDKLRTVIAGATKLVEERCGTCVQRVFTDDQIPGTDQFVLRLPHGPCPTTSSVTLIKSVYPGGPQWTTAGIILSKDAGTIRTLNQMGFYYGPWLATYTAGRLIIPPDIINGFMEIVWDLWATKRNVTADIDEMTPTEVAQFEAALAIPANYRIPIRALAFLEPHFMPGFA